VAAIFLLILISALRTGEATLPSTGAVLVKAVAAFQIAVMLARFVVRPK